MLCSFCWCGDIFFDHNLRQVPAHTFFFLFFEKCGEWILRNHHIIRSQGPCSLKPSSETQANLLRAWLTSAGPQAGFTSFFVWGLGLNQSLNPSLKWLSNRICKKCYPPKLYGPDSAFRKVQVEKGKPHQIGPLKQIAKNSYLQSSGAPWWGLYEKGSGRKNRCQVDIGGVIDRQ